MHSLSSLTSVGMCSVLRRLRGRVAEWAARRSLLCWWYAPVPLQTTWAMADMPLSWIAFFYDLSMSWKEHCFARVTACHPGIVPSCSVELKVTDARCSEGSRKCLQCCFCSMSHLVVLLNSGYRRCFSSVWLLLMTLLFGKICRGEGIYPLILQDFS